jgi:hypothetical protein
MDSLDNRPGSKPTSSLTNMEVIVRRWILWTSAIEVSPSRYIPYATTCACRPQPTRSPKISRPERHPYVRQATHSYQPVKSRLEFEHAVDACDMSIEATTRNGSTWNRPTEIFNLSSNLTLRRVIKILNMETVLAGAIEYRLYSIRGVEGLSKAACGCRVFRPQSP